MTTTVTKTIRSSGGDYTTLSAWEAAQQGDLVAADELRVAECYDDWASGLDDAVTVSGSTTDSTRYMKITVASGHRHNGTPQSGFFMESSAYNQAMIILTDQYSVAEWVDVKNTKNLALTRAIELSGANTALRKAIACATNRTAIYNSSTSTGKVFESCLAYSSTTGYDMSGASTTAIKASNCAAANCTTGFFNSSGANDKAVINCVAYGCTTSYTASAFDHASSTNNAASDGSSVTPPGSNPITTDIVSGDFSNAASNNFHLSGTGSALYHAGSNTTSATHDIDGVAFHATTPSVGFDEIAANDTSLSGNATDTATATGALTTQIPVAGAAVGVTTSQGSLATGIQFVGNAATVSVADGVLTAQIKLAAAAVSQSLAAAGLTTGITLSVMAAGDATATGDLTAGGGLSAAAQALASGTGDLTIQIRLAGAALAEALATGALSIGSGLSGDAQAVASASGALITGIPLAGAALTVSSADGNVTAIIQLAGAAASVTSVIGSLDTLLTLNGEAVNQVLAGGDLTAYIKFDAAAVAQAAANGVLSDASLATVPASRTLRIPAEDRVLRIPAEDRVLRVYR